MTHAITAPDAAQHVELADVFVDGLLERGIRQKELELIELGSDTVDNIMANLRDTLRTFKA